MDDLDRTLTRLQELLREERAAIISLDAARVTAIAGEKEALCAAICRASPLPEGARARLAEARRDLQQNIALLIHARDCVQGAIAAARPTAVGASGHLRGTGIRINVTG